MFLVWAILLLVLGLGLAILEIFFPSAGILGFLAASSILGAIIMAFRQGPEVGLAVLAVAILGLPSVVILALKWWPKTPMGRKVMLMSPRSEDVLPDDPQRDRLKGLIGQVGRAKCKMLPSGAISIDGRTIDAVSEGIPIEPGQAVRVIEVRANRVVVRPVEGETPSPKAEDPLRRPIDAVAPDPFEEPPD
jgi:membrane-bound serine protease (ClpP class)